MQIVPLKIRKNAVMHLKTISQKHRLKNLKDIVIGHLNVNSVRSDFEAVEELPKIDKTFSKQKLMIYKYPLQNCKYRTH